MYMIMGKIIITIWLYICFQYICIKCSIKLSLQVQEEPSLLYHKYGLCCSRHNSYDMLQFQNQIYSLQQLFEHQSILYRRMLTL